MAIVTLGSLVFTLLSTAVATYLDYTQEMDGVGDEMEQIRATQLASLANSVWHFDDKQIDTQLQGLLNLPDIRYLVLSVEGGPIYTLGQPVPAASALTQVFAVNYTPPGGAATYLGQLRVVATTAGVWGRMRSRLAGILWAQALQIFLLAGFILVAVEWLFARPLNAIASYAETLNLDHLEQPLTLPRPAGPDPDELGLVARALNEMRRRLLDDVTERQRMEAELRQSERNYREIFNAPSEAIMVHAAPDGALQLVNAAALRMYGYASEAEVLACSAGDLSAGEPPYTAAEAVAYIHKTLEAGPQVFEWLARKKSGERFWVEVSLRGSQIGGEQRVLAVVRDITERKESKRLIEAQARELAAQNEKLLAQNEALAEQGRGLAQAEASLRQLNQSLEQRVEARTAELSVANGALQRAARLKDEFLASMSHELRTPLTGILTLAEALLLGVYDPPTARQREALGLVHESGQHLLDLITDILDVSKIEAGKMTLQLGPVGVDEVCQASLQFVWQLAQKKRLRLSMSTDPAVAAIRADARRLKQMLINLLSNAVKFTPEGGAIGLEVTGDPARGVANFTVWDTGIGIAPEDVPLLFRPFTQLDNRLARQHSGTGLGLSLVMGMAELHGGRVSVESEPGRGSRFTLALPWQPSEALAAAQAPGAPAGLAQRAGAGAGVLLAEDNEMVVYALTSFLAAHAYQVHPARDGREALEQARRLRPALILLDIQLPLLDGLQVLTALRADPDPDLARTPVIALTALAMPGDRERCLAAGASEYLTKPVNLEALLERMEKLTQSPTPPRPAR